MITLAEPTTAITDYVLSAVAAGLGWSLIRRRDAQWSRTLWAGALAALALTALIGGTYHGFAITALWPATVVLAGVISFAMLAGSAMATTTGAVRRAIVALAALKLIAYVAWTAGHDDFVSVIVDSGIAMLALAGLHAPRALVGHDAASRAMLGAVALSVVGAGVQASGFALHRHFNHNDLFHVVQIAATVAFYRGARRLRDRP
jgi:hypothetical protein